MKRDMRPPMCSPNGYFLDWDEKSFRKFWSRVMTGSCRHGLKELHIRGPKKNIYLDYRFDETIRYLPDLEHLKISWHLDGSSERQTKETFAPNETSMCVIVKTLRALEYRAANPMNISYSRVRDLYLDRVYWTLFSPQIRTIHLSIFPYLHRLTLDFKTDPGLSIESGSVYCHEQLGIVLRDCFMLKTLCLRFGVAPLLWDRLYTLADIKLPPNFSTLADVTAFGHLEELTLENVVLDENFATSFFLAHGRTLKKVNLISLWNSSWIQNQQSAVHGVLTNMALKDIEFGGLWTDVVSVSADPKINLKLKASWDESRVIDFEEMKAAGQKILLGGRNLETKPQQSRLQPSPVVPRTRWQRTTRSVKKFFQERIFRRGRRHSDPS